MDENVTKPTIETVLIRMDAMEQRLGERIEATEQRLDAKIEALDSSVNERIEASEQRVGQRMTAFEERLGSRLDRIEGLASTTRGEVLDLRADFRDLRSQLREHIPAIH